MKIVFLRMFALALVVAMGLLAIAHAQRATPDTYGGQQPPSGDAPPNPLRIDSPADNSGNPPSVDPAIENPLRPMPQGNPAKPIGPIPGNAPISSQDNPLRPGLTDPAKADPFRRPSIKKDRAVRTAAGIEPETTPTGPALIGPLPTNSTQAASTLNADKPRAYAQGNNEPALLPPGNAPDLTATPPFGDNRLQSGELAQAAAVPASTGPAIVAPASGMPMGAMRVDASVQLPSTSYRADNSNSLRRADAGYAPLKEENSPASNDLAHSGSANSSGEGTGLPGDRRLEGPQSPQLMVQKQMPPEVQVGRPAVLRTIVRNTGAAPATDVEIHDMVPKGSRLLGTAPHATQGIQGELTWKVGDLKPGDQTIVEMQIMPVQEGDMGSVATVQFQAAASARSRCTRPRLIVTTTGTPQVLMGDEAALTFTVSNPGTGTATGVVLQERIPAGAQHPAGAALEYTIGDLRPGESRKLDLRLKAVQAGTISNVILAKADAGLKAEHRFAVRVVAPQLDVVMNGPKHRYLEREATYQVSVSNPGTAPAQQIQLVAYLPPGLKFVNANNAGHYDEASRAVSWRLDELPVNAQGSVELVTLPVEAGQQSIKLRGTARRGLAVEKDHPVIVEGLASVSFQMAHTRDPIEIGGETSYEVSVVNQGSKASTNVRLTLSMPPQLKPTAADGPARYALESNQVVFESLPQLPPKSVVTYRVKAKGIQAGDLRIRCQLMSDEMQAPVSKEDSTRVYGDE